MRDRKNAQRRTESARAARRDARREAGPRVDENRRATLRRYGITPEQFDQMAVAQNGRCAICGEEPSGRGIASVLHVDHDHESGRIRGLLCTNCNRGIGLFRDDPDRLREAIDYLSRDGRT